MRRLHDQATVFPARSSVQPPRDIIGAQNFTRALCWRSTTIQLYNQDTGVSSVEGGNEVVSDRVSES